MKIYFRSGTFFLFVLCGFLFLARNAYASTTAQYSVTSGYDASTGTPTAFSTNGTKSDIAKLAAPDNKRIQSNASSWPTGEDFEEDKYIEFIFSPNMPSGATIESVSVSHEFRRSGSMHAAKLEVWDGSVFTSFPLTLGAQNVDHTDTIDISSLINTPEKVNNFKARFLGYRGDGHTKTSHDYIGLTVTYAVQDGDPGDPGGDSDVADGPAVHDQTLSTSVDVPLIIDLAGIDPNNDPLTYAIVSDPEKGIFTQTTDSQLIYTPRGALGTDAFTYTASDGVHTSLPGTIHITNTVGAAAGISIDAAPGTLVAGETATVAAYAEDMFGNVRSDAIQLTATGDAVLDGELGTLTKPTSGTVLLNATNGVLSADPVEVVFTDPQIVQSVIIENPQDPDPVIMHHGGGAVVLAAQQNLPIVEVKQPMVLPEVQDRKPVVFVSHPIKRRENHIVKDVALNKDVDIQHPELLGAQAESAAPVSNKTAVWASLGILTLYIICRKIFIRSTKDI